MSSDDSRLICLCYGIRENEIREAIIKYSIKEIEEVTLACDAGGGCGACHLLIQDLIDEISS